MDQCKGCLKQTEDGKCVVFDPEPENCWAWTDDREWLMKVTLATKRYKQYLQGLLPKYW